MDISDYILKLEADLQKEAQVNDEENSTQSNYIKSLNIVLKDYNVYRDHFTYTKSFLKKLLKTIISNNYSFIITTEKDLVKLPNWFIRGLPLYVLKMHFDLNEKNKLTFFQIIKKLII